MTAELNSERKEKLRLEKRLKNSFLDEFRDKVAEIRASSVDINAIQARERSIQEQNKHLEDEVSSLKEQLNKIPSIEYSNRVLSRQIEQQQ